MSLNRIMLIGNIGKDPQLIYTDRDRPVCRCSIATTEPGYTTANGTQVPPQTDWHNILLWGALAEYVGKYCRKGDKIYVEGKLKKRDYTDKEGKNRSVVEVWAENVELLTKHN